MERGRRGEGITWRGGYMERDYMERGLHGEVKRDTHGEGTFTERKLHGEGRDSSETTQNCSQGQNVP